MKINRIKCVCVYVCDGNKNSFVLQEQQQTAVTATAIIIINSKNNMCLYESTKNFSNIFTVTCITGWHKCTFFSVHNIYDVYT